MDPQWALLILSWIAIVVLYLGLAAVLREVRMLRQQLDDRSVEWDPSERDEIVSMPQVAQGRRVVVLAADSTCPLCRLMIATLAAHRDEVAVPVVVMGYEAPGEWGTFDERLTYVQDPQAWQQIAHLSPPVLLLLDERGIAEQMAMPSSEPEATHLLNQWGVTGIDQPAE